MPVTITWDNAEQSVIRAVGENWSTNEFHHDFDTITHMIRNSQTHVLGIIVENLDGEYSKRDYMSVFKRVARIGKIPTAFVKLTHMQAMMLQTVIQIYKPEKQIYIVNTLEEARSIICQNNASI